jgi:hypothetical protein
VLQTKFGGFTGQVLGTLAHCATDFPSMLCVLLICLLLLLLLLLSLAAGQVWWLHWAGLWHAGLVTGSHGHTSQALLAAGAVNMNCF